MAKESISFPEDRIPDVVRVIRKGLKGERDRELRDGLKSQCDELMDYHERLTGKAE
jgi:hypothetical protein